ncbi:hypothetical protein [Peterkaempfera sp. SMS 1(5)a]|uniref:hypothetical protein n=1 Tax=Peterkaempfera podocarpi TaxID=3232308 RepID=UPI00366DE0E0
MAMSTVVGISVATTWIISVQGSLPPSVRISDVNSAPSTPGDSDPDGGSPDADPSTTAGTGTPQALAGRGSPQQSAASRDRAPAGSLGSARPTAAATPPGGSVFDATRPTPGAPGTTAAAGAPGAAVPSPGADVRPGDGPAAGKSRGPRPGAPTGTPSGSPTGAATGGSEEPAAIELTPSGDEGLHGWASADTANPYASRDSLDLAVDETLTAVEVEVRVERSGGAANCGAWTDMPGAEVTVELDHDTLVYRFTLRHGRTVHPGHYSFAVQYSHRDGIHDAAGDTWLASAFGVDHPRAVAVRGRFA